MRKDVLVTGATGCVGRAVVEAALSDGWHVRGYARRPMPHFWPRDADYIVGAVEDREALNRAASGCESIVHLAGNVHSAPQGHANDELWGSVVDGTRNVVDAAQEYGARVVLASTAAVYGTPPPAVCDERTPTRPESPYAVAKLQCERLVAELGERGTVLRLCAVYGRGDRGNVAALVGAADRGLAVVVGSGSNRKSLLYSKNLADRVARVLGDRSVNGVWCVSDGAPTQSELLEEISRAVGRGRPFRIPFSLADLVARILDTLPGSYRRLGTWRQRVATLASPTELRGDALDARLRYAPRASLREAMEDTVRWYRQRALEAAAGT